MNLKNALSVSVAIIALSMLGFGLVGAAVTPLTFYTIGDANGDDEVNITDPIYTLQWLFLGGEEPPCQLAADANGDDRIDLSDVVVELRYLFSGGVTVPPMFGVCSMHTTVGRQLTCEIPSSCPGVPSTGN